jgi:putative heme iron utilization protein
MFINIANGTQWYMVMKKVMVALPDEMVKVLEKQRKDRLLETIPETIRVILSEYLSKK